MWCPSVSPKQAEKHCKTKFCALLKRRREMLDDKCAATAYDCPQEAVMSKFKITALYERLSKDDGDSSQESNSIATQKAHLL
jgi:hypothetical protein